jgi:hypothetical protein
MPAPEGEWIEDGIHQNPLIYLSAIISLISVKLRRS